MGRWAGFLAGSFDIAGKVLVRGRNRLHERIPTSC